MGAGTISKYPRIGESPNKQDVAEEVLARSGSRVPEWFRQGPVNGYTAIIQPPVALTAGVDVSEATLVLLAIQLTGAPPTVTVRLWGLPKITFNDDMETNGTFWCVINNGTFAGINDNFLERVFVGGCSRLFLEVTAFAGVGAARVFFGIADDENVENNG